MKTTNKKQTVKKQATKKATAKTSKKVTSSNGKIIIDCNIKGTTITPKISFLGMNQEQVCEVLTQIVLYINSDLIDEYSKSLIKK